MNIGRLKHYKPITSSMRHIKAVDLSNLSKTNIRFLCKFKKNFAGRNNSGRITVDHRGFFQKRKTKLIDYYYTQVNVPGVVLSIEFDPNRSSFISLVKYENGFISYRINTHGTYPGDEFKIIKNVRFENGFSSELKFIPEGSYVHNVELRPDRGGSLARAAGTKAVLLSKNENTANIKLPSKKILELHCSCKATIGVTSNIYYRDRSLGNFGNSKKEGRRPHVRGVAKNPIDHPHGGGEGKRSKRKDVVNFTGKVKRGKRTFNKNKPVILVNKLNRIVFK